MKNKTLISFLWHENESEETDEDVAPIVHAKITTCGDTYTFCGMDCTPSCSEFKEREIKNNQHLNCPMCIDRIKERIAEITPLKKLLKESKISY